MTQSTQGIHTTFQVSNNSKLSDVVAFTNVDHLLKIAPFLDTDETLFLTISNDLSELLLKILKMSSGWEGDVFFNFT